MLSSLSLPQVLAASDVVLEVLDARDPQGCRSPQLEAAVRRAGARQRLVLVLNKIGKMGGGGGLGGAGGAHGAPPVTFLSPQTWCRGTWWRRGSSTCAPSSPPWPSRRARSSRAATWWEQQGGEVNLGEKKGKLGVFS